MSFGRKYSKRIWKVSFIPPVNLSHVIKNWEWRLSSNLRCKDGDKEKYKKLLDLDTNAKEEEIISIIGEENKIYLTHQCSRCKKSFKRILLLRESGDEYRSCWCTHCLKKEAQYVLNRIELFESRFSDDIEPTN